MMGDGKGPRPETVALTKEFFLAFGWVIRLAAFGIFLAAIYFGAALLDKELTGLQWFCLITASGLWWIGETLHDICLTLQEFKEGRVVNK
jgi:hypothetical protein